MLASASLGCRIVSLTAASARVRRHPLGKRDGTSGHKSGPASRQWAFSAAAVLCLRQHAAAPKRLARVAKQHGTGKALTV
jgi:hypothetical protein